MTHGRPWTLAGALLSLSAVLGAQGLEFPDQLIYNDFYAVEVFTGEEGSFTLFDAASIEGDAVPWPDAEGDFGEFRGSGPADRMKYFFWVRRMGAAGAVTYPLPFRRILEIRFDGPFGGSVENSPKTARLLTEAEERSVSVLENGSRFSGWYGEREPAVPAYTAARITLSDGSEQDLYVKTDGFLGGIDENFGTYAMLWLRHEGISRLEFNHNGTYSRCPECGAIFYDDSQELCPFDGETLIPARER